MAEGADITEKDVPSATNDRQRGLGLKLLLAAAIVLFAAGLALVGFLVARFTINDSQLGAIASEAEQRAARWPDAEQKKELTKAQAYNVRLAALAAQGRQPIGTRSDPFNRAAGSSSSSGSSQSSGSSSSALDKEYNSLLNEGDGIMGTIEIPEISVKLPIYHGTSDEVLASGAGHIEGTSLPIGGKSTHAVLAAHRGLPSAMMFTRIDELRKGDPFYIRTISRTIAYRVDRISVVGPNDTSRLKIVPGQDRVTLYTCTPYGVNTKRLLVSGVRATIPSQVPEPADAGPDWHKIFGSIGLVTLLLLMLAFFVWMANRRTLVMQHGPMGKHARWSGLRPPKRSSDHPSEPPWIMPGQEAGAQGSR
jgi:sortase A